MTPAAGAGGPGPEPGENVGGRGAARSLLRRVARACPGRAVGTVALSVAAGLTEGIGLLLVLPLLHLVGVEVGAGEAGRVVAGIRAVFEGVGLPLTLATVLIAYVGVVAGAAGLRRARTAAAADLRHGFVGGLRRGLYRRLAAAGWPFFAARRRSDLRHALAEAPGEVGRGLHHLLELVAAGAVGAVYLAVALLLEPVLTLLAVAAGGALTLAYRGLVRRDRRAGEDWTDTLRGLYAAVGDHLDGMRTAKAHGSEGRLVELFEAVSGRLEGLSRRAERRRADVRFGYTAGSALLLAAVVYGAVGIGSVPAGELLVLLVIYARLAPRLAGLVRHYLDFRYTLPAYRAWAGAERAAARAGAGPAGALAAPRPPVGEAALERGVRLEGVTFGYGDRPVVRELSLEVPAGSVTALVGSNGAGKTTVLDLVVGLLRPDRGAVRVDGRRLTAERAAAWRRRIGFVGQETFLFSDTVAANLRWTCPEASRRELVVALERAGAGELVVRLPEGLETEVGDRGERLSGGEARRLALARALVRRPVLLVLDEPTRSLDDDGRRRLLDTLRSLAGPTTVLLTSHRDEVARAADVVHELRAGRVRRTRSPGEAGGERVGARRLDLGA